jgi:hypothetical protein
VLQGGHNRLGKQVLPVASGRLLSHGAAAVRFSVAALGSGAQLYYSQDGGGPCPERFVV